MLYSSGNCISQLFELGYFAVRKERKSPALYKMFKLVVFYALLALTTAAPSYVGLFGQPGLSSHSGFSADFPIIASLVLDHRPGETKVLPQPLITAHGPLAVEQAWRAVRALGQDLNGYTFPLRHLVGGNL